LRQKVGKRKKEKEKETLPGKTIRPHQSVKKPIYIIWKINLGKNIITG